MNIAIKCFCISVLSFCFHSAYSQQTIEYSLGLSLNLSDRLAEDNDNIQTALGIDDAFESKFGFGVHTRALTKFNHPINLSFGPGITFKSTKEFSTVIRNEVALNLPLLLHYKIFDDLEVQAGASYGFLINRSLTVENRNPIETTDFSPHRHFVTPTLGLAYILKEHIELNMSYHVGVQQSDSSIILDVDGNVLGNIDQREQYFQFALFFRNMGKFKKGNKAMI